MSSSNREKAIFVMSLLYVLLMTVNSLPYKKIVHTTDPDARCLDGTPPALYIHQGNSPQNILIFLQGGGYCTGSSQSQVIQQCYKRSKTLLGSSLYWPDQFQGQGYLSTDPQKSKFAQWTKIILAYCDGSLYQGHRNQPINYKGTNLYFRGQKLMKAQLQYINNKYGLMSAQKVVWTGGSAGGVGTYLWMNTVRSMVSDPQKLYIIPDSGIFIDFPIHLSKTHQFMNSLKNLYQISNLNSKTPIELCDAFFISEPWKCLLIQYNYQFLRGKMLLVNSQYDSWAIYNILKIKCLTQRIDGAASLSKCSQSQVKHIEQYRKMYQQVMENMLKITNNNNCWSIGCSNHVYACIDAFYNSGFDKIPQIVGLTAKQAIQSFVFEEKGRIIATDLQAWPKNQPCS